jgi:hypothetical protein
VNVFGVLAAGFLVAAGRTVFGDSAGAAPLALCLLKQLYDFGVSSSPLQGSPLPLVLGVDVGTFLDE